VQTRCGSRVRRAYWHNFFMRRISNAEDPKWIGKYTLWLLHVVLAASCFARSSRSDWM